jgi:hypothetical protein
MLYWMVLTDPSILERLEKEQKEALALDEKTVDKVAPGEQQPEVDHKMEEKNSTKGTANGEFYRDAGKCSGGDGGLISYEFETNSEDSLSLMVRYWGNEGCTRTFDISIDGEKLTTETISNRWKKEEFVNVTYPIPDKMIKDKKVVRISFSASSGMVGGIYGVRLLRNKPKPERVSVKPIAAANSGLRVRANAQTLQVESSLPLSHTMSVKIYSMDGRLKLSQVLNAGSSHFDVNIAELRNGNYIVRLYENGLVRGYTLFNKNGL